MKGAEIKKVRTSLGMDVIPFSQLLGVSPSTVYRWEAAGSVGLKVDPLQVQIMAVVNRVGASNRLGSEIHESLMLGGTMLGMYRLLDKVYGGKRDDHGRHAVRGDAAGAVVVGKDGK